MSTIKHRIATVLAFTALVMPLLSQANPVPKVSAGSIDQRCSNVNSRDCANVETTPASMGRVKGTMSKAEAERLTASNRSALNDSSEIDKTPGATSYCTAPDGNRIPHGSGARYFFFPKSTDCERDSELRECRFGVLGGTATLLSCEPFRDCIGPGYNIRHGQAGTFSNAARSSSCQTASRTCNDGVLGGNSALTHFGACVPFINCTHHGVTIGHGSSRVFYRVNQSTSCASEATTVSCNDGSVSGSNLSYSFSSCSAPPPPPPPADCPTQGLVWSASGASCSATAISSSSGQTRFLNSVNGNAGSASYACNSGTWQLQPGATCTAPPPPAAGCPATNLVWNEGSANCSAPTNSSTSGGNVFVNSNNGNTGSASFACSNGSWLRQPGATCTAPPPPPSGCSATTLSWNVGSTSCSAPTNSASNGGNVFLSSSNGNTGSAGFTCSNGVWSGQPGATCTAPPPPPSGCSATTLSWNVGSTSCTSPIGTATSGASRFISSNNGNTGNANFLCNNGNWQNQGGATCTPPPPPPVVTCSPESKTWSSPSGHSCTGALSSASPGQVQTLTSTNQNTGSARYTCTSNGSWSSPDNASCNPPANPVNNQNCTYRGIVIPHGGSRDFFRVSQSANCSAERTTITCNNGNVSGNTSYEFSSCTTLPPAPTDPCDLSAGRPWPQCFPFTTRTTFVPEGGTIFAVINSSGQHLSDTNAPYPTTSQSFNFGNPTAGGEDGRIFYYSCSSAPIIQGNRYIDWNISCVLTGQSNTGGGSFDGGG